MGSLAKYLSYNCMLGLTVMTLSDVQWEMKGWVVSHGSLVLKCLWLERV
jgi:hypothetical protein